MSSQKTSTPKQPQVKNPEPKNSQVTQQATAQTNPTPISQDEQIKVLSAQVESLQQMLVKQQELQLLREEELDRRLGMQDKQIRKATETAEEKKRNIEAVREVHENKRQKMRKALAKQPKVRMYVPLEGKEPVGSFIPVTLNGHRVNVPKGVYVDVPQQVADIIADRFQQIDDAGKKYRLDLIGDKMGDGGMTYNQALF